jgi:hypothetical protein
MEPYVWGPYAWVTLHYIALGYPENPAAKDKQTYKTFYQNLCHTIPCDHCCKHYTQYFKEHSIDPYLDSAEHLFQWTWELHNAVNRRLGKPEMNDFAYVYNLYMNDRVNIGKNNFYFYLFLICLVIIAIMGYKIYYGNVGSIYKSYTHKRKYR